MPPIWVGFWVQSSVNKCPFFGRFSLNIGGFFEILAKLVKNGYISTNIHHKNGYDGNRR